MLKAIIFDFDGTLVRSHYQVYGVLQELAAEYHLTLLPAEKLRHMDTIETVRSLGLRLWQVPRFTALARQRLSQRLHQVHFEPGILPLLEKLAPKNLALVSSNSQGNVNTVLNEHQARKFFTKVICGSSMLGKHRNLQKAIKTMGLHPNEIVYVGDECRDIEAGQKVGCQTLGVSWGFHARERLLQCQPDRVVDTVEELGDWLFEASKAH